MITSTTQTMPQIEGRAMVFNKILRDGDTTYCRYRPGCFARQLLRRPRIPAVLEHDVGRQIGVTGEIWENEIGLDFRLTPYDNDLGHSLMHRFRQTTPIGISIRCFHNRTKDTCSGIVFDVLDCEVAHIGFTTTPACSDTFAMIDCNH